MCDAEVIRRSSPGTTIGMNSIKQRRLYELTLACHPELHVGDCVPFYFCPRSVMLYLIYMQNHPELEYRGGQIPIVHLEADLKQTVAWANQNGRRWAFTLSNAGAYYFEDRCDLNQLHEIDWEAVKAKKWSGNGISSSVKEGKQAEFLLEGAFPWRLITCIGVCSKRMYTEVSRIMQGVEPKPPIEIKRNWYYP